MSQINAKEQLTIQLATKGILGDRLEPEIDKIVASIPEATRSNYPEDRYEAALSFLPLYEQQEGGTPDHPTEQQPAGTSAPATVSAAQATAIAKILNKSHAKKEERTAKTNIDKLLIDKPAPDTYLDKSMKIVPVCKPEKLAEYQKQLDTSDPANVAAFQKLADAVKNQTPMDIYINKPSNKVMGYVISTPAGETGSDAIVQKTLTSDAMLGFVTTQLDGYIPTKGDGLGVKLRWNKPRANTGKASSKRSTGTPTLVIGNKQEAIANPERHEIISMIEKNGDQIVTKKGKLRTELSFRIDTGEQKQDGTPKYRTIRFSGDADVPKFVRKTDEYTKLFGATDRDRNSITAPVGKEADVLNTAMTNTIAYMMNATSSSRFDISGFADEYSKVVNESNPTEGVEL